LLRLFTPYFFYKELESRFPLQSFVPLRYTKGFPLQSGLGHSIPNKILVNLNELNVLNGSKETS